MVKKNVKEDKKVSPIINQMRKRDAQIVKGQFHYLECPGGILSFNYKAYAGDPVVRYDLTDGEVRELPLGVARHLNTNVAVPEHQYLLDKNGRPSSIVNKKTRRCSFENIGFTEIEELSLDNPGNFSERRIEEANIQPLPSLER